METYRIPPAALRRQYLFGASAFPIGGLVAWFGGVRLPLGVTLISVTSIVVAVLVAYSIAKRRVWVTLMPEGIQGRGISGGKTTIAWSTRVILAPIVPPAVGGTNGVTILRVGENGKPLGRESVFVPQAIYELPAFQVAVQRHAPSGHPLLQVFNHAT